MRMFEFLLKAYLDPNKNVGITQIEYAFSKGWITEEEKIQILNSK